MRIASLQLKNFKRFTHLRLENIPIEAKLVLLIGANGSGKSSVFDAFECINSTIRQQGTADAQYYRKEKNTEFYIDFSDGAFVYELSNKINNLNSISFYGRTSFRQIPQLTRRALGEQKFRFSVDSDRPRQFIQRDDRFENDVEHITGIILDEVFNTSDSTKQIRDRYIEPLNAALERIFGAENGTQLRLIEIIPPLEGRVAQINFIKGKSKIHYDALSAGEKEVFNVLLNLLSRRHIYDDTVYFYDELDLHLNTAVQFSFLEELIKNWIPNNCQLWTASHSLGFIEFAKQSEQAVILDFDNFDFDQPQMIVPQAKDRLDIYEIAVPKSMLFEMMRGKKLVVCENQNDDYYNLLGLPDTVFIGVKDSRDVFLHVKRDNRYYASLRDRDYLSDTEITRIQNRFPQHRILKYYDFENYLYHPDNIAELNPAGFEKDIYVQEIAKQKNERLHYILPGLVSSRQNYEEFKTDEKLRDKDTDSIVDDFKSDEFERFYKYFDMKDKFHKHYLASFNLSKKDLVTTAWFKNQIAELLK
ncbi:MAG TPA: AAA family ATPase [Saprospiraceae bacterium]|nr:AAA family ATPase [Saprospiraceae bacterium]